MRCFGGKVLLDSGNQCVSGKVTVALISVCCCEFTHKSIVEMIHKITDNWHNC